MINTQLKLIFEILEEDSIEKTSENLIFQINSPDFYSIDDIIDIAKSIYEIICVLKLIQDILLLLLIIIIEIGRAHV